MLANGSIDGYHVFPKAQFRRFSSYHRVVNQECLLLCLTELQMRSFATKSLLMINTLLMKRFKPIDKGRKNRMVTVDYGVGKLD
jgi:hypothetical protein